jgi:hypothetical protein
LTSDRAVASERVSLVGVDVHGRRILILFGHATEFFGEELGQSLCEVGNVFAVLIKV